MTAEGAPMEMVAAPRRSYWVDPHRFLAGAYPGSPDAEEHERRVGQIWSAGARTFVNLVEPDESANGSPFARYDTVVARLSGGEGAAQCLRFPIRDLSVPTAEGMRAILDAIDASLAADRPVYVHCWGGIGRTGTVVACWLLRHRRATTENVLAVLAALRVADREACHRRAPETPAQERFVRDFRER